MKRVFILFLFLVSLSLSSEHGKFVQTEYSRPFKAVVELFLESPEALGPALGWISNIVYVLSNPPYNYSSEDIDIVVVSHGRELPVFAMENRERYKEIVERVESLSMYGVKFMVCNMAARQLYGYTEKDFYPFVTLVPSALTEIIHWQQRGYGLLTPRILEIKRGGTQ